MFCMKQGPVDCLGSNKSDAQNNALTKPPSQASKHAGKDQYPTFSGNSVKQKATVPSPPPRLLCTGAYYTRGGGGQSAERNVTQWNTIP